MMIKQAIAYIIIFLLILFSSFTTQRAAYIKTFAPTAQKLQFETGVPASIQLAQAIFESGGGVSHIAKHGNAHFGIRYFKGEWDFAIVPAKEGVLYRAYPTIEASYYDHACFMSDHYAGAVGKDWKHWVKYCKGYGGHPDYWGFIEHIIILNKLYIYD